MAVYDLYRKVPITPYGGTLTSVVKQITYKSGAYEPLYKLSSLQPSVTTITMSENDTYNLENVNINAKVQNTRIKGYQIQYSTNKKFKKQKQVLPLKIPSFKFL